MMAQYFDVVNQGEKSVDQQFFPNVEDQTVQYVITPDKTQVQYPAQQIVVTSGDQLMVVDGQPQPVVLDQSSITYQTPQIQQTQVHVSQQPQPQLQGAAQYTVIQENSLNNGTQQIFLMDNNGAAERVIVEQSQSSPQPIVLNHQINHVARTTSPAIRAVLRPPLLVQHRPVMRPTLRGMNVNQQVPKSEARMEPVTSQQQARPANQPQSVPRPPHLAHLTPARQMAANQQTPNRQPRTPNPTQFRQQTPRPMGGQASQQLRPGVSGQVRVGNPGSQPRLPGQQIRAPSLVPVRTPNALQRFTSPQLPQKAVNQPPLVDLNDLEIKPSDEQDAVTLPDGNFVTMAYYKKMLMEQKSRNPEPKPNIPSAPNPPNPPKKRAPPKNSTRIPKTASRPPPRRPPVNQFVQNQQPINNTNDPSQYAMMNQQAPNQQVESQNNEQLPTFSGQQSQHQQQVVELMNQLSQRPSQAGYIIQPPQNNQGPQQQRPLPSYISSSRIKNIIENTPRTEEYSNSIRMLVLLENGEQRLITFTLPRESCTIQEILEQVNVPFQPNVTNIQVLETNSNGLNYIVTVGNFPTYLYEDEENVSPNESAPLPPPPTPPPSLLLASQQEQSNEDSTSQHQVKEEKSPSPEPPKLAQKFIPGMWALCSVCGYLSEDFNSCIRCRRKLPENVKAIPATTRGTNAQKKEQPQTTPSPVKTPPSTPKTVRKKTVKSKVPETESVHVISSDEEEEESPFKEETNILEKLGASVSICPISKEPSPSDIQRLCALDKTKDVEENTEHLSTTLICRTVRIGSYRCIPFERKVIIDSKQVLIKIPHPGKDKQFNIIKIEKSDMVKVLACFNISLQVLFYYLDPAVAQKIRDDLDMTVDGDYYYDPLSTEEEAFRRITLLPDDLDEEQSNIIQQIYANTPSLLEELNVKEANDILIKTCPKEMARQNFGLGPLTEIKQLLTYPPEGRGRITINTEDYVCLAQDQFLNDVIIDFYLKYLVEHLPEDQKSKVHVFSTFFYKRLTTKPAKASRRAQPSELDPTLSAAQKRHMRVKTWTKNVDLFQKDFVIVPINENAHWFLAIICFPGMNGCQTWDGKPYTIEVKSRRKKVKKDKVEVDPIGAVKQEKDGKMIICEYPESDKDEAEGEESEMDSDDSEEVPSLLGDAPVPPPASPVALPLLPTPVQKTRKEPRPPIKQPCILIFDSLAGANRSRVVATLRDYLTCEHKMKLGFDKPYTRDVIKGANPKVPQQNNFTDCGLYVLQYVEQFFKDPIKDYYIPIKDIKDWFDEFTVTKKREDLAILIKSLMKEYGKDVGLLPDVTFPTLNGKIIEPEPEEEEEDEAMDETEHTIQQSSCSKSSPGVSLESSVSEESNQAVNETKAEESTSPIRPSNKENPSDFLAQPAINLKPDPREFPRQTNKDTLSILKAKRIIKNKCAEGPEGKKAKIE